MNTPLRKEADPSFQSSFIIDAYSKVSSIRLKSVLEVFRRDNEEVERRDRDCVLVKFGTYQRVYFYAFGAAVFVNVGRDLHSEILAKVGFIPQQPGSREGALPSVTETEDDFHLLIGAPQIAVGFDTVQLPAWKEDHVGILARTIAQSSALELIENEVEQLVGYSEKMTGELKDGVWFGFGRRNLIQFMRRGLEAKHKLVTQLALLRDPEVIWEDEGAYKLYNQLSENFDIWERLSTIESMLELPSEVARLHFDIRHARWAEMLEIIIIILIAFEIIQTLIT
jgi:uncharacterized Rmd1/YagE family protein